MPDLETCRCLTELIMSHGAVTKCGHCDNPCTVAHCPLCLQVNRTCTDCGTTHCDSKAANQCEMSHPL
ncbi:MAG: hypothetical protein JWP74_1750 [Marmoricola sp.]|nr:hypothetical protein [Marmoricola sp.]